MNRPDVVEALVARYGWVFLAWCIFYPVYRDFMQGVAMGLLGF